MENDEVFKVPEWMPVKITAVIGWFSGDESRETYEGYIRTDEWLSSDDKISAVNE